MNLGRGGEEGTRRMEKKGSGEANIERGGLLARKERTKRRLWGKGAACEKKFKWGDK